ncbi:MAG: cytidine deaminase [Firmicutes bacterium]|nr:cytidine deaminase [Bacillota bacterium]
MRETASLELSKQTVRRDSVQKRPSWDEYFMQIADLVSTRSTCLRRQVGALLVKERRIIATGYNGAPRGLPHCAEVGCLRQQLGIPSGERHEICRGIHAEQNAILQAALYGVSTEGAVLYCTTQPCAQCTKILINAGVSRIVYCGDYPDPLAQELLQQADVVVERWTNHKEG